MFDPEQYPVDYSFLTDEQKENIINYMAGLRGRYWSTIIQLKNSQVDELNRRGSAYIEDYRKRLNAARDALIAAGIYVEYGWRGHQNEWFLATRDDAYIREDDFFEERG